MLSLPTWVEEDLKTFLEILFLTYEVKPYNPKILQTSSTNTITTRVVKIYKKQSM